MKRHHFFGGAVVAGIAALAAITLAQSTPPQPAPAQPAASQPARPVFVDGQAQIVPAFQDATQWITQTLWVETEFDSDRDGKRDRVFVDVTRPRQTDTEGLKVPIIYESSPYFAGTSGPREFLWDVKQEVGAPPPPRKSQPEIPFKPARTNVSTSQVSAWVPRGFAVVHSEAPGTGLSDGCPTVGGAPEELAPKAVVDWLNGRAKGFTTKDGTETVSATSWSTGKVGMTGTSYNGTLPVAAATTGVAGLEAIIPIAPNTSYYHYYRSNGLVRHPGGWLGEDIDFLYDFIHSGDPAKREACNALVREGMFAKGRDREHGDYNAFWAERDLLKKVGGIKAAVLMAHAFNDWNVVPEHSVRIAMALKGKVPLQMYFHQGGHGGAPPMEMMNKWFTRYLYGVKNGVENDPKAWIVRETAPTAPAPAPAAGAPPAQPPAAGQGRGGRPPTPPPTPYADYPNPAASPVTLHLGPGGATRGQLVLGSAGSTGTEKLVDNVEFSGAVLAKAEQSPNRLIYATPELSAPLHLSGTARITLRLASSKPAANLSVWLVTLPWTDGPISPANLITRGWADPQNYESLKDGGDYHSMAPGKPLTPGRFYPITFDLEPDDQIIPAGKRIGLMILSSDRDFTLWPAPGTELTIDLAGTTLRLPIVGGAAAFKAATSTGAAAAARPAGTAGPRFDNAEYAARRAKLMEKIPDGVAIIWGAQTIPSYYRYSQNNDFMYLTGAEIPNAVLIVDGPAKTSTLVFTSTEAAARNDGIPAELVRDPKAFTGIERVAPMANLDTLLAGIAARSKIVYTSFKPEELYREASNEKLRTLQRAMTQNPWDGRLTRELQFVKVFKERYPLVEVRDCSSMIWELRTIKSRAEIALMRRAGKIGAAAHTALIKATKPGLFEYELSALFNYMCEKQGAQESAYGVIISSGENHPYVHYNRHDRQLKNGDFIVVDAGPDLDYYDIDITTSFPANGKFTPRQKEVYEASLAVHEANLKVYRPGLTAEQCRLEVEAILTKQGFDLKKDYFQRMRGGFGHFVGMATHDVGGAPQVLKVGMVFANEPYMTWPGEDLGVRVEDTVVITETGCENLTAGIPRSIKEIEAAMAAKK